MSAAREDYIRVKRKNQTFFIHTSPSDAFARIKQEISEAMGGNDFISPNKMRLYLAPPKSASNEKDGDKEMGEAAAMSKDPIPDAAILSDHDVKNDGVLYVTFAKGWESGGDDVPLDGDDVWEEIEVVEP